MIKLKLVCIIGFMELKPLELKPVEGFSRLSDHLPSKKLGIYKKIEFNELSFVKRKFNRCYKLITVLVTEPS